MNTREGPIEPASGEAKKSDGSGRSESGRLGQTKVLGKYKLIAELGSGGMANVYLAVMRGLSGFNKLVVVKLLRPGLAQDGDVIAMFLEEARLAARLNHPNVVQTNEVSEDDGTHMIVMEYLDGATLNQIIERTNRRGKPLPLGVHLKIIVEALHGLHYAHESTDFDGKPLELVHRDISPHNIFVTFDGQVKVLDFGIAKIASSTHDTRTGVIKGKIRYMAPEQLAGDRVDRRADIFAVGAMLWEAATGVKLWKGKSDVEIMSATVNGKIPSPREVAPDANETLDRICRKALAVDRDERYSTCDELQVDLERLLDEIGDRTSVRDIGRMTVEAFDDVRAQRKKMIEAQLRGIEASTSSERSIVLPDAEGLPTLPALPAYTSGSGSHPMEIPELTPSGSKPLQATAASLPPTHGAGSKVGRNVAIVLALVAVIGVGFVFARRGNEPTSPVATASAPHANGDVAASTAAVTAPASTAPAPPTATAVQPASIKLRAEPADAKLFLDGKALPTNPYTNSFAHDGASHELRAEAKGFAPKSVTVTADSGSDVMLTLDRLGKGGVVYVVPKPPPGTTATATATPTTTAAPPPTTTEPAPAASGKKPPKAIDSANPWD